jgi:hypothetical protein
MNGRTALQDLGHIGRASQARLFSAFDRSPTDMRRKNDVISRQQTRVDARFILSNVHAGAFQAALVQRHIKGLLINHRPPGHIE